MDEVRARNSLNEIISRHVKLTRKGHEQTGLCPFHSEKTPSFTVSEDKGFFHCFGCGAHGDIFGFTMRLENLTFPEAVEKLATEAGLTVPRDSPKQMEEEKKKAGLQAVMERATEFFQRSLHSPEGAGAIEYLKSRGLNSEVIGLFRLGYAPNGGRALLASLLKESIPGSVLEQCGLVVDPGDGRSPYDRFRDRVMFPITDERDRVIAFGARTLEIYSLNILILQIRRYSIKVEFFMALRKPDPLLQSRATSSSWRVTWTLLLSRRLAYRRSHL